MSIVITGTNLQHLAGIYRESGFVIDGRPLYDHETHLFSLRYCAEKHSWISGPKRAHLSDQIYLHLDEDIASPDLSTKTWREFVARTWYNNDDIKAIMTKTEVCIVSGCCNEHQARNGVYRVVGRVCNEKLVFVQETGINSVWFCISQGAWILGESKDEGSARGYLRLVDSVASPDLSSKAWAEYGNGRWSDIATVNVSGLSASVLVLHGCSVENLSFNGVYRAVGRICDGKVVFEHEAGGSSIRFHSGGGSWILGGVGDEGSDRGFLYLVEKVSSPDLGTQTWRECKRGNWADNTEVKAIVLRSEACVLSGCCITNQSLNGVYRAVGRIFDDKVAFEQVAGDNSIWFNSSLGSWILGARKEEGSNKGYLQLAENVASPDLGTTLWRETVQRRWSENSMLLVIKLNLVSLSLSGCSAQSRDGVYRAVGRVCNGRAVFEQESRQHSIRYCSITRSWILGVKDDEGSHSGFMYLPSDVASPELASGLVWNESVSGIWFECSALEIVFETFNSEVKLPRRFQRCNALKYPSAVTLPITTSSLTSLLGFDARIHWESNGRLGLDKNKLFLVEPCSNEFRKVETAFMDSLSPFKIVRIERVENGSQHKLFSVCKNSIARDMRVQVDDTKLVRHLFHGTSEERINFIVQNPITGFSPLLSQFGAFGSGTYFAVKSLMSHMFSVRNRIGHCKMILAEVVVGRFVQGSMEMRQCPLLPGEEHRRFHSLVDYEASPAQYVIQNSMQAYPAYVITYL